MSGIEIALIGAAIAGGVSTVMQGQAAAAQGRAQKKMNEYNALQAEREAKARLAASKLEAAKVARKGAFVNAANRAIASKSGISISDSPSTIDVIADTAYQFYLDTNMTLNQGMQDYASMMNQGSLLRAEGAYAKAAGQSQQRTANIMGGIQIGAGLISLMPKPLAGNQAAISSQGGLSSSNVQNQASSWMSQQPGGF